MPRATQIVPEKKYPFVECFYNDNSGWTDDSTPSTGTVVNGFRSMCVFAASKGIDDKLVTLTSVAELEEEFGKVNFKTFGQPMLNAHALLSSGDAIVHCMRVLPSDANTANVTVNAKVLVHKVESDINSVAVPTSFKAVAESSTSQVDDGMGGTTDLTVYSNKISWDAITGAYYEICINNETSNLITVNGANEYTHENLVNGNSYIYKVRAVTTDGTSTWSNPITIVAGAEGVDATATAEDIPNTTLVPERMIVKFEAVATDGMKNEEQISSALAAAANDTEPDEDGFITVPLFTLYSLGRGIYGNNYRFRVSDSIKMTEEYGINIHQLEIYDTTDGMTLKERFYFSFDVGAIFNRESVFIADIIGNPTEGSKKIGCVANEEALQTIFDMYNEAFPDADVDIEDFNIISGTMADTKTIIPNFEVYTPLSETEPSVSLSVANGIPFMYGSDGSFATSNPNLQAALDAEYLAAFNKEKDMGVVSKRRYPVDVLLDANYPQEVKLAMAKLALERTDCQCIIDANIINSKYEAYNWADSPAISSIDDWAISKVFQNAIIKDPYTGRSIRVTATYFYALLMPNHYMNVGRANAMVGTDYGVVPGIVNGKIYPLIEFDDDKAKTSLIERKLNWIEAISNTTFVIGVQNTSQMSNSDMIEMSNAAIVLAMKRRLDDFCTRIIYKFAEADDRTRFTTDANFILEEYKNDVRDFEIYFDMNKFEEQRSILHCYLSVTFKTIVKNVIVEIDINNRVNANAA